MNNNVNEDVFYGGSDLSMEGGEPSQMLSFQDFLNSTKGGADLENNEMSGGVRRKKANPSGDNVEVEFREGYDSFTIVKTNVGEPGGRYISKTPNGAASKVASRLLREANKSSVKFVIQKTTRGSNHRYYAYEANVSKLSSPVMVFKKDEQGNKIVMNKSGQVLRVKNDKVVNVSGKTKPTYDPETKVSNVQDFDYKPYLIKEVTKKVNVKSVEVPEDLKQKYMESKKGKKDASKVAEKKAKMAEKKAKMAEKKALAKAKMAEKKALAKAKKAEKKEAEKAKKAEKKEAEKAKKANKKPKATKPKAEKKPKATKPKGAKKGAKKMMGGGSCGANSCN